MPYDTAVREPGPQFLSTHSLLSLYTIVNSKSILINIWLTGQRCQQTKQENYKTQKTAVLEWNRAEETQKRSFTNSCSVLAAKKTNAKAILIVHKYSPFRCHSVQSGELNLCPPQGVP